MTRIVQTTPMKARTSAGIRKLAAQVAQTFPDMSVHDHLTDAARELEYGRTEGARRHLNAAIEGFAPLQITRHGVHDDQGHMAAKLYMQQAYRHLLNVKDIEDVRQANEGLAAERRAAALVPKGTAMSPSSQPVPVGAPNGAPGPVAAAPAVAPQAQHLKALAWEDITNAIELATFAGAPPGSGKNFAKLKGSLAKRGARNPGALAAWIGRKKYGKKGFAKLSHGSSHASQAGGIELVGPKGYIHGWIRASAAALGTKMPHQMSRSEHRKAASAHLRKAQESPADSDKARLHSRFARMHAAASLSKTDSLPYSPRQAGKRPAAYGRGLRPTNQANPARGGIELTGPKGYSHGWVYHGTPKTRAGMIKHIAEGHGAGLPTGRTGFQRETRTFEDFASEHEAMHRMNPGQNHTHEPPAAKVAASVRYSPESSVRDFEALASMPPFSPAQSKMLGIHDPDYYKKIRAGIQATIQASWEDIDRAIELSAETVYSGSLNVWPTHTRASTKSLGASEALHATTRARTAAGQHSTGQLSTVEQAILRATTNPAARVAMPSTISGGTGWASRTAMSSSAGTRYSSSGVRKAQAARPLSHGSMASMFRMSTGSGVNAPGAGSLDLSAETGRLATEPHPFGKPGGPGLWGVKGMELPPYIQNIARALLRTGRAKTLSQAIAIARGASKRWAAGGGNVRPEVRAASAGASASWASKQARAHAHASTWSALDRAVELAGFNPAEPRTPTGTWGAGGTAAGKGMSKQQLTAQIRADRARLKVLHAELARLTTIKHKTTAAAQKAAATGKTAKATPAKKGAPAKAVAGGRKAPTRAQQITSIRGQIKQLLTQIAADQKKIAAMANEPGGLLLAS